MIEYPENAEWTAPKTDWLPTDAFCLQPDYLRLFGNIGALHREAQALYHNTPGAALPQPQTDDIPTAEFFNRTEQAAQALTTLICPPYAFAAAQYAAEGTPWTADTLNRLERALQTAHTLLASQRALRPVLRFTLGAPWAVGGEV